MKNRKAQEKRRQKKQAKQRITRGARLAAYKNEIAKAKARQKKLWAVRSLMKGGDILPPLNDEDYVFWLCHGANYIASDSASGVWSPIFEDIYPAGVPSLSSGNEDIYQGTLPAPEAIATQVMTAYREELEAEGAFKGVPRAVLAWSVTDKSIVTIYKHEAIRRLREKDPECDAESLARAPHNPTVWTLMDRVKERSLAVGAEMDTEPAAVEEVST